VQFGPNGEQTGGEFLIKRPGKIRFNYENPSPITVVSNGRTLAVENKKLKTTLRQWTIKDAQGKETSVMIFNVKKNMKISNTKFAVDKSKIHNRGSRN